MAQNCDDMSQENQMVEMCRDITIEESLRNHYIRALVAGSAPKSYRLNPDELVDVALRVNAPVDATADGPLTRMILHFNGNFVEVFPDVDVHPHHFAVNA